MKESIRSCGKPDLDTEGRKRGGNNKEMWFGGGEGPCEAFNGSGLLSLLFKEVFRRERKKTSLETLKTETVHVVTLFPPGPCCSGLSSGMCPSRCVLQSRAVLHGCLESVCGGADISGVCQAQRWVCQEATCWRPLWCQNWTRAPGTCVPENCYWLLVVFVFNFTCVNIILTNMVPAEVLSGE